MPNFSEVGKELIHNVIKDLSFRLKKILIISIKIPKGKH